MSTKSKSQYIFDEYSHLIGNRGSYDYFDWEVYLSQPANISKVKEIEYRLHETFPDPVRVVKDKEHKFRIKTKGWGTFRIYITIYLIDGSEIDTSYQLKLNEKWPPKYK